MHWLAGSLLRAARTMGTTPTRSIQVGQMAAASAAPRRTLVTTEINDDGVALLTLNNPDKLNAMTVELGESFANSVAALKAKQIADRNAFRAVVITGAGRAFSAGGDMKFLRDRTESDALSNANTMKDFYARFLCLRSLEVPTIAAINGPAIGAGLCVAAACDMRICATDAKMGWTFVGLGLHPGMAATHYTAAIIGPQNAAKYLLTGKVFDGAEALRIGLVLDAVERDHVLPEALKLAASIAKQSSVATQTLIRTMRLQQDADLASALNREADCQAHNYASADILEGITAIQERRAPVFNAKL